MIKNYNNLLKNKVKSELAYLNNKLDKISSKWRGTGPVIQAGNPMASLFLLVEIPVLTSDGKAELLSNQAKKALYSSLERLNISKEYIYISSLYKFYFDSGFKPGIQGLNNLKELLELEISIIEPEVLIGFHPNVTKWLKDIYQNNFQLHQGKDKNCLLRGETIYFETVSFEEALKDINQKRRLWKVLVKVAKLILD